MKHFARMVCDVLDQQPVKWEKVKAKKHNKWNITLPDGSLKVFIGPETPSCWRAPLNTYQNLRTLLKEAGCQWVECKHLMKQ